MFVNPVEPGLAFPHPAHLGCVFGLFCSFPLTVPPVCCSVALSGPWWWQEAGGCSQLLLLPWCEQALGAGKGNFKRIFSAVTELLKVQFFGLLAESFRFSIKNGNV